MVQTKVVKKPWKMTLVRNKLQEKLTDKNTNIYALGNNNTII